MYPIKYLGNIYKWYLVENNIARNLNVKKYNLFLKIDLIKRTKIKINNE